MIYFLNPTQLFFAIMQFLWCIQECKVNVKVLYKEQDHL